MDDFAAFRSFYKPALRPEGTVGRVRHAMGIDAEFLTRFRFVRHNLQIELTRWPEAIALQMMQFRDLSQKLDMAGMDQYRDLFEAHRQAILRGDFEAPYFDSIEDLTLFFIYHDLRAV